MIFAQQLFHKYRVKRKSQYTEEDKRITNELMDLWHEASGEENPTTSNYLYSDPQWNDEWYLVREFMNVIKLKSPTLWEKLKIEFLTTQAGNPMQVTPKQSQIDPMQPTFSVRTTYYTHAIITCCLYLFTLF